MFVFRKIWRVLFSCYLRFEIRPFGLIANDLLCFLIETRKDLDANLLMYINEHFLFAVYKYYLEIVCEIFIFMDVVTLPSFCMEDNWK